MADVQKVVQWLTQNLKKRQQEHLTLPEILHFPEVRGLVGALVGGQVGWMIRRLVGGLIGAPMGGLVG